ncbi:MAG: aminodeoxychorismate/anthranilate synthase component II [Planctomycetes bacterium]|nr:aminodeoxychorismate/anthranilate synthase component II [Planctomycetota bacterium]
MILLVDNYDSFTWNLWQGFAGLGLELRVVRNDALTVDEALSCGASGIVLSPGPGHPRDSGICPELLRRAPDALPILGVCLGHQALVERYGGELEVDPVPVHGKASLVHHDRATLLADLPNPFQAGRYHSLRAVRERLPRELVLCGWTADGLVMAVQHERLPRFGVQFHPESILTPEGERVLARFLIACGERAGCGEPVGRVPTSRATDG